MRLIDADELKEHKFVECLEWETDFSNGWNAAIEAVVSFAPTVEVEPTKHGYWIDGAICSVCGELATALEGRYCENCGAKMDLDEVEE